MPAPAPWHTRAKITGVPLAAGAELGIKEAHSSLAKHTAKPGWWGTPRIFGPKDRRLRTIELSCEDRLPPAWEHLRARQPVLFQSTRFEGACIPAGLTAVALRYSPAPDPRKPSGFAVIAHRADDNSRVPASVEGKTVRIEFALPVDVLVRYRPIYPCKVLSFDEGTGTEIAGRQSWGLTLVVTA